jgi:cytochrome c6
MRIKLSLILLLLATNIYANIKDGKDVYLTNCANCHSTNMKGGLGRDFNLVSYTRTKEEIIAYTTNPGMVFRSFGYPANAMPTLPLTKEEIKNVADYIDSLQPFKKWMVKTKVN